MKISVLIPTYNNKKNLKRLIKSLLKQRGGFNNSNYEIVIHFDNCTDGSESIQDEFTKSLPIRYIRSKTRKGFTASVKILVESTDADIYLLLNDDILLKDWYLLKKIVKEFEKDKKLQILSGNPYPYQCSTFIEKACLTSFNVFYKIRYEINNGINKFTCDGKIIAFRKSFVKTIRYPIKLEEAGNLDSYFYFFAKEKGYKYNHLKEAKVYFKFPNTVPDYIKWTSRNNANRYLLKRNFDPIIIDREYSFPKKIYYYKMIEFIKNPFTSLFIFILGFYIQYKASRWEQWLKPTWSVITSTKKHF